MGVYEQVDSAFNKAATYASAATSSLAGFTNKLDALIYTAPTFAVNWNAPSMPGIPSMPSVPVMPNITFAPVSGAPSPLSESMPGLSISTFSEVAPSLAFPSAPTLTYGSVPSVPSIGTVTVPDVPLVVMPTDPVYMSVNTVSFAGVDLREDWLDNLENIPTLDLVEPTPYSYAVGPEYASSLLTNLKALIADRLAGGTGIPASVEQAIWDRARSRETTLALANEAEVMRQGESFGFRLPSGTLAAQLREAQQGYYEKLSGLSRDVAIKQAELEQENIKLAIAEGMKLEEKLIDQSYRIEQLTFEAAKAYADNSIQTYNAAVDRYKALLQGYQTYASAYKTIIDGQMAKVEVFKAQLSAEQTKAEINRTLVEQYKASIEAGMAHVEIYRAQVGAAQTLVQLEQAKISAAGEQIRAYVAQVNAETSKVEAYKATVQAEATKIEVYKVKADVFSAKVGAEAEYSRALISRFTALAQAKSAEWDGYRARVGAESARIEALGRQSSSQLDGYRAAVSAIEATANTQARLWDSNIRQYEAGQNFALQAAKVNSDFAMTANSARLDAAKVGAQVYAQLTSSAYSMIHASAGISGSQGISFSYSGETAGPASPG